MLIPFDFKYTHAIVSRVPYTITEATFRNKNLLKTARIDLEKAREHQNEYILALR